MLAGRTLRDMGTELDEDRVIADYADGRPVEEIEAAYGLTRDEIEYLVAAGARPIGRWSLQRTGNRVLLAVLVGLVIQYFAGLLGADAVGRTILWAVVSFAAYLVVAGYAGKDSSR